MTIMSIAEFAVAVMDNQYIPTTPTLKQAEFLTDTHPEVLYGGAAGGGKSIGLLMAALMYVTEPDYSALILRRTYQDLALPDAVMDVAEQWLMNTDAHWDNETKTWSFPSGASVTFGYLQSEKDKYRYQGAKFNFIGFDELTQFQESQYLYLFSRLRRKAGSEIPSRMRATSNPGGIGHSWVKDRFITSTHEDRIFIPAKLTENPYLDQNEYLSSLSKLDHITRAQLRDGNWEISATGELFKKVFFKYCSLENGLYDLGTKKLLARDCRIFQTCDPAISTKASADYFVLATWASTPDQDLILLDILRTRLEGPDQINLFRQAYTRWKPAFQGVEAVGVGKTLYQMLLREGLPIRELKAEADKVTRAMPAAARMEAGCVYFLKGIQGLDDFENELLSFPKGAHDDCVDVLSYAVSQILSYSPFDLSTLIRTIPKRLP